MRKKKNKPNKTSLDLGAGEEFIYLTPKAQLTKEKNLINWTSSKLKLLLCERPCEEDKKTMHWLGENDCNPHIKYYPEYTNNSQNSVKIQTIHLENGQKTLTDISM